MKTALTILFAMSVTLGGNAYAERIIQQTTTAQHISTCKHQAAMIDYYSKLRRKGGKSRQMEYWRQQRKEYEELYQVNVCDRYIR